MLQKAMLQRTMQQQMLCPQLFNVQIRGLKKSTRLNRKLRQYRNNKIQTESSYFSSMKLDIIQKPGSQKIAFNQNTFYNPDDVFDELQKVSKERKFVESVELCVKLNVEPTRGDQNVRGTCVLPSGTGKEVKVCVFAAQDFHAELLEAGADIIGTKQILEDIAEGKVEFDKLIAAQDQLSELKQFARILGPKGLFPNAKSGTLVKPNDIVEQVRQAKQGMIEYRVSPESFINNKIGLRSFSSDQLKVNFNELMLSLIDKRPDSVKGRFFNKAYIKTTMGPNLRLNLEHYHKLVSEAQAL